MAELKTKATAASVASFLKAVEPAARRQECETLVALLKKVTKEEPKLWGTGLIGFGQYHYVYESGREGDWPLTGFSPRKQNLTLYVMDGVEPHAELMRGLGKFTTGKGCLYVKTLEDVDLRVLETLVTRSIKNVKAKYAR